MGLRAIRRARLGAVGAMALVLPCAACAPASPPAVDPRAPPKVIAPAAADGGSPPPDVAREVTLGIVGADGAHWPALTRPDPPGEVARPCAGRGAPTGWAIFSIPGLGDSDIPTVTLVEASGSFPEAMTSCLRGAIQRLRARESATADPRPLLVYVSVR